MTDQAVDIRGPQLPGAPREPQSDFAVTEDQFLGRTRELKELHADIARTGLDTLTGRKAPRARVLLIAGKPGSGRTALARALAAEVADGYPDGVLYTRLAEADGSAVPVARAARELLDALGRTAPPGADEDELTEALRAALAGRRAVLLLDDTVGADQVDALLPDAPDCLAVAVARGPLTGIPDVRPCALGGLDTQAALTFLSRFTGSVRITVDPRAAEALVEECAGQPAALTLAGGWLAVRPQASVSDLARRLHGEVTERTALARVFRHVYESLPVPAARALRSLCLAPGGTVDTQTASALIGCSVSDAAEALDDFTATGLLRRLPGDLAQYEIPGCLVPHLRQLGTVHDRAAELQLARARMLERTVRLLHACRILAEPEGSPARTQLAQQPGAQRFPSTEAAARWLTVRRPALLAAARSAVADGQLDTLARRLASALLQALAAHHGTESTADDLYALYDLLHQVAGRRGLHAEAAAALLGLADLDARSGRTEAALDRYRDALDAARAARDPHAVARATECIGSAHEALGDWQRAADWYGRALAQCQSRNESAEAAVLHGRIGSVLASGGQYAPAQRSWRASAAGHRRVRDVPAQARALGELARVQVSAGEGTEALRTCHEAVERARGVGDTGLQAGLQFQLADLLDRLGDPAAAGLHRAVAERMLAPEGRGRGESGGESGTESGVEAGTGTEPEPSMRSVVGEAGGVEVGEGVSGDEDRDAGPDVGTGAGPDAGAGEEVAPAVGAEAGVGPGTEAGPAGVGEPEPDAERPGPEGARSSSDALSSSEAFSPSDLSEVSPYETPEEQRKCPGERGPGELGRAELGRGEQDPAGASRAEDDVTEPPGPANS
ncbi:hypothetical protein HUT18_04380 [Streptomyces sp. NA04227]|nr:hypothetical protein HUT18_04380 [Streptomyces sp. NA04227]